MLIVLAQTGACHLKELYLELYNFNPEGIISKIMLEESIESFEKDLQGAVRLCVQRLKHGTNSKKARADVMYDFNQETQRIVASAEQYFSQESLLATKDLKMDQINCKVMEAFEEIELHVSVLPPVRDVPE